MIVEKQKVLADAESVLNKPDQPWAVTIERDAIVARWKWMDAQFFGPQDVNDETKEYTFTVTLNDKGKWREADQTEETSKDIGVEDGKLKIGGSKEMFKGKTTQKSVTIGFGKNKQTGEAGIVGFKFDTSKVKEPIRAYLTDCGWKKAGLFG